MLESINNQSAKPLHQQVEEVLRQLIAEEKYQNGALLPTEVELSAQLKVARNTVRAAMDKLVRQGLVTRKKGVGTQVVRVPMATDLMKWQSFTLEFGDRLKTLTRWVEKTTVDAEKREILGAETGQSVLCLRRVKGTQGQPLVLLVSYFPPALHLLPQENFEGRLYAVLKEKYGLVPSVSAEEIGAMMPDPTLRRTLELPANAPVLFRKRHVFDAQGRLIELAYAYYRADRFTYRIDIHSEEKI